MLPTAGPHLQENSKYRLKGTKAGQRATHKKLQEQTYRPQRTFQSIAQHSYRDFSSNSDVLH